MLPTMEVTPVVEIADFAKITKLPAVPRSIAEGLAASKALVVKVQTWLLARALPARSLAPVVIVAGADWGDSYPVEPTATTVYVRLARSAVLQARFSYGNIPRTRVASATRSTARM